MLSYDSGTHAALTTSLAAQGSSRATIIGRRARIEIYPSGSTSFSLIPFPAGDDASAVRVSEDRQNGLRHQAVEVGRLLRDGATESPDMPLDESVMVMEILDEVRYLIGLAFP